MGSFGRRRRESSGLRCGIRDGRAWRWFDGGVVVVVCVCDAG